MAENNLSFQLSGTIGADVLVDLNDDGKLAAAAADSARFIGQTITGGVLDDTVAVITTDVITTVANAAILAGTRVKNAGSNKVAPFVAATDGSDENIGVALTETASDGDAIEVLLN